MFDTEAKGAGDSAYIISGRVSRFLCVIAREFWENGVRMKKADVVEAVCLSWSQGQKGEAGRIARDSYPFVSHPPPKRRYTDIQMLSVWSFPCMVDIPILG